VDKNNPSENGHVHVLRVFSSFDDGLATVLRTPVGVMHTLEDGDHYVTGPMRCVVLDSQMVGFSEPSEVQALGEFLLEAAEWLRRDDVEQS
jgi:hypothetical protein